MSEVKEQKDKAERFTKFTKWAELANHNDAPEILKLIEELEAMQKREEVMVKAIKLLVSANRDNRDLSFNEDKAIAELEKLIPDLEE